MIIILFLLLFHTIADFIVQTRWQGNNKSHNIEALIAHVSTYTLTMFFGFIVIHLFVDYGNMFILVLTAILFSIVTYICHFITDLFSSKLSSRFYKEGKEKLFWAVIGFDQFAHIAQIIITYNLLIS